MVVWLIHGVHGNEISSADAALAEAYHLLASQGDAGVDAVLRDALVLIDPMQNPDGRARFVASNLQGRAVTADPAPYSAEHDEPWPGGRSNHYLFDMNRDWFAQSQPETRGRIKIGLEFQPQITVDLHEQGGDNAYYFSPPAEAINPHVTKSQIAGVGAARTRQCRALRRARLGVLHPRGLRRVLSGLRRFVADVPGIDRQHLRAGVGARPDVRAQRRRHADLSRRRDASLQRRHRHRDHRRPQSRAVHARLPRIPAQRGRRRREGPDSRNTCIVPGQDASRADALARNLATQGIEVRRAEEPIKLASRTIPAGAYLVSNAQPTARMIRNLLDPKTEQSAEFIKKQEERRKMRLNDQIYDITAWNLPMLFDVETRHQPVGDHRQVDARCRRSTTRRCRRGALPAAKVGYLMPWGSAAVALSADAMRQGIRIRSVGGAFTHNGRRYPIGTAFIRNAENPRISTRASVGARRQARRRARADRFHLGR